MHSCTNLAHCCLVAAALAATLCAPGFGLDPGGRKAAPLNPGFETGDLSGWVVAGSASHAEVLTVASFSGSQPPTPTEGNYFVLLSNGPGEVNPVSPGNLDGDSDGYDDFDSTSLSQSFTLLESETPAVLSFDWSFVTSESDGSVTPGAFDDFFLVRLDGVAILTGSAPGGGAFPFPDVPVNGFSTEVTSTGATNGSDFEWGHSQFQASAHTITTPGTHTIVFLVADQNDGHIDTGLLIDNVKLTRPADLVIEKNDEQLIAHPGEQLTYVVTVSNLGPGDAVGATVSDIFPEELLDCSWTCGGSAGASCSGSGTGDLSDSVDLPMGGTVVYGVTCLLDPSASGTVSNTATVALPAGMVDPDPSNNSATDTDLVGTARADLVIEKTDQQTTAVPGESITYLITASNLGPTGVVGAAVSDVFPAELSCTWVCIPTGGASCTESLLSGNVYDLVDLPVGAAANYIVSCDLDPAAVSPLVNTAAIVPPAGVLDPFPGNNTDSDVDALAPGADLVITTDDGQTSAAPGGTTTYTITAGNPSGPSDAPAATVTDVFPPALDCSWTCVAANGGACTAGPVAGDIGDVVSLPRGASVEYTAICSIDLEASGTLVNTATVTTVGDVEDPNPINNSATDGDTALSPKTDLSLLKEDSEDPVPPGQQLTYVLTVTNHGPSHSSGGTISDQLPLGVSFAGSSDGCQSLGGEPESVVCQLGPIPATESQVVTFDATVNPGAPDVVVNTATVTASETDPVPTDNSATEETVTDVEPPEVTALDSQEGTGDGQLAECETARVEMDRILVTFDEEVLDPPGDAGPDDVTNPANHILLGPGANLAFDTFSCQGVGSGDDVLVPAAGIAYSAATGLAEISYAGALPDGQYRLLVCGSTSIRDLVGNPLDGDGDGNGGDDFTRGFRIDSDNLFDNGHFDCQVSGWQVGGSGFLQHDLADVVGSAESGSARVAGGELTLYQCTAASPGALRDLDGWLLLEATSGPASVIRFCEFFAQPLCEGRALGWATDTSQEGTTGVWSFFASTFTTPEAATSARCGIGLADATYDALLDDLFLGPKESIFEDGFESGDASGWSAQVPWP